MSIPINAAIDLALSLLENASRVSSVVRQAQAAGQEKLTDEQWASIQSMDDAARNRLELAIAAAEKL